MEYKYTYKINLRCSEALLNWISFSLLHTKNENIMFTVVCLFIQNRRSNPDMFTSTEKYLPSQAILFHFIWSLFFSKIPVNAVRAFLPLKTMKLCLGNIAASYKCNRGSGKQMTIATPPKSQKVNTETGRMKNRPL